MVRRSTGMGRRASRRATGATSSVGVGGRLRHSATRTAAAAFYEPGHRGRRGLRAGRARVVLERQRTTTASTRRRSAPTGLTWRTRVPARLGEREPDDREPAAAADSDDGANRRGGVIRYGPATDRRRVNLLRFGGQPQMVGRGNTIENVNVAPAPRAACGSCRRPRAAERSTEHPRRAEADRRRPGSAGDLDRAAVRHRHRLRRARRRVNRDARPVRAGGHRPRSGRALAHAGAAAARARGEGRERRRHRPGHRCGRPRRRSVIVAVAGKKGVTNARGAARIKVRAARAS